MKNFIRKNWRDAASLIVLSKRVGGACGGCNYDVLLQTRTENASFKNSVVFPGGVYEAADANPAWLKLLQSFGFSQTDFETFHRAGAPVTPLFQDNPVQRQIALRITAIRETFEELGLLLCSRTPKKEKSGFYASVISDVDLQYWQNQVSKDPSQLLNLCNELHCYPDIWSLHYWSNWLTPSSVKHRFDTAFYITALDTRPTVKENSEVVKVEWHSPAETLEKSSQETVLLYPPQCYELHRLSHLCDLEALVKFARQRSNLGGHLFYHVNVQAADGRLFVYPGDELFPATIDYEKPTILKTDKTIADLRESSNSAHRIELRKSEINIVLKNFRPDNVDMGDTVSKVHMTFST